MVGIGGGRTSGCEGAGGGSGSGSGQGRGEDRIRGVAVEDDGRELIIWDIT